MNYLIAGLGNIGTEYEFTRHNAGFLVVDKIAENKDLQFELSRYSFYSKYRYRGKTIHLIKPTTYMNNSGKAINYWLQKLNISIENTLIIVDDISLPFGRIRLRAKGSSAGHNGLSSVEQHLGSQAYARLKIGIGNEFNKGEQVDFVLSQFNRMEIQKLDDILKKACDIVNSVISIGIEKSMSQFNRNENSE